METESLIPKGPKPDKSREEEKVNERYATHENTYDHPPPMYDYEPLPQEPPETVVNNYGGIIPGHAQVIDINNTQEDRRKIPNDFSGLAWLSCLFCCLPLAIAAIYQSNKVILSLRKGDLRKARVHSIAAKNLSALAIIFGLLFIIILAIVLYVLLYRDGKL